LPILQGLAKVGVDWGNFNGGLLEYQLLDILNFRLLGFVKCV
jgi:hypothetical protein